MRDIYGGGTAWQAMAVRSSPRTMVTNGMMRGAGAENGACRQQRRNMQKPTRPGIKYKIAVQVAGVSTAASEQTVAGMQANPRGAGQNGERCAR